VSFLERLERACAVFVERTFAKTFPSDLEPAQIARKLVSTMEAHTTDVEGTPCAPGEYCVYVNPTDYERLEEHREYLERAWAELLTDLAGRVGMSFAGDAVRVAMSPRGSIPLGAIEIELPGAAGARARFRLRMIEGVPPDGLYAVESIARVGRGEGNDVFLADPSVSREHAVVDVRSGDAFVRDLGSTNGTFVNGSRTERRSLRDGDELCFGNTRMRFESR
jgi:hypothetical protein